MGGPEIGEATIDLGAGVRLRYAECGAGPGTPAVLLHGYTDCWRSFSLVMGLLGLSRRVVALDLRGHGRSSAPPGGYRIADFAGDVATFLGRAGLGQVALVGHSMGSFVARRVALDSPDLVQRLVLVGSALTADNQAVRRLSEQVSRFEGWVPEAFVEAFQAGCVFRRDFVPEWFFRACVATSRRTPPRVWRAALDGMLEEGLADMPVACPSLIIGGLQDAVFSPDEQEQLALALGGVPLRLYRHAGHSPHWEEPGRFAEDVEDFLEGPA